jgi:CBS domain-containing protein
MNKMENDMKQELVNIWMTKNVITADPTTTLPEAHQIMMENNIRRLPVVEKNGRLLGIVTLGDIRGAQPSEATSLSVWEMNYLLAKLKLKEIMTRDPVTIEPDATIGEAARLMLENKVSGLPVVDSDHKVIGVITESDIFSMVVLHEWEEAYA